MSRLTTKQRRARLWRRDWQKDYRDIAATTEPGFPVAVWLMTEYAQVLSRHEQPFGLGLRYPQQAAAYWKRLGDRVIPPADRARGSP